MFVCCKEEKVQTAPDTHDAWPGAKSTVKIPAAWLRTSHGRPERVWPSAGACAPPRTWRAASGRTPVGGGAKISGSSPLVSAHLS